jgi:hypothetical protein
MLEKGSIYLTYFMLNFALSSEDFDATLSRSSPIYRRWGGKKKKKEENTYPDRYSSLSLYSEMGCPVNFSSRGQEVVTSLS